jgi:hypothetical protein
MVRYSYSLSFTPRVSAPGRYQFYVTANKWVDERCVSSEIVGECLVGDIPETDDPGQLLQYAVGMADIAYTEVNRMYAKSKRASDTLS